jgi:hypothetical protein
VNGGAAGAGAGGVPPEDGFVAGTVGVLGTTVPPVAALNAARFIARTPMSTTATSVIACSTGRRLSVIEPLIVGRRG